MAPCVNCGGTDLKFTELVFAPTLAGGEMGSEAISGHGVAGAPLAVARCSACACVRLFDATKLDMVLV